MTMTHCAIAQLGNHYVYCTARDDAPIYDIYGFDLKGPDAKYQIQFKHTIHLQYQNKRRNVKLLCLQHNCVVFGIESKKTLICLFRFRGEHMISKHIFQTAFHSKQVINCHLASNMLLLFEIKDSSKQASKRGLYYALYMIHNQSIAVQYIRSWSKGISKPLIHIAPSLLHPMHQLASCLTSAPHDPSGNVIWTLSQCIPESYLRHLTCITPHSSSFASSQYTHWLWWIGVQRPCKECKVLLIQNKQILTRITFPSQQGMFVALSLRSVNSDTVLLISQTTATNEMDDDDIDMEEMNESHLECHIIKRDSLERNKSMIQKEYNQWFDNHKTQRQDPFASIIYKVVYHHAFENGNALLYDANQVKLMCFDLQQDTFSIYASHQEDMEEIQWEYESLDLYALLYHKIPKFFQKPLQSLKVSHLKQLQKCFEYKHKLQSQFINEVHCEQLPLRKDEIIHVEWSGDDLRINLASPLGNHHSRKSVVLVLSCPYIRFSACIECHMQNPTVFMQSMVMGDFVTLKQDLRSQSMMIHLFERNSLHLERLCVFRLSLEHLTAMKCNAQQLHFYDGLQQNEMNDYLCKTTNATRYDGWLQYFSEFLQCWENKLQDNVTQNGDNFYRVLESRLCGSTPLPVFLL
eukprot:992542_1